MKRPKMTPARRFLIWTRDGGICESCLGFFLLDRIEVDHRLAWWISHDDTDENLRVLCLECHRKVKTPQDAGVISKIKRLIARRDGTRRERQEIMSRGFDKRLRRKMDGTVERRDQ